MSMILVIVDPTTESVQAEQRAMLLAEQTGAAIELLVCDSGSETGKTEHEALLVQLEQRADALRSRGLEVGCELISSRAVYEGILGKIRSCSPDLVIKESRYHPLLKRTLYSNTDWELIRRCPVPLLLVKQDEWHAPGHVVAAVDPLHLRDKPAALDGRILDHAAMLAGIMNWQLWALHCWPESGAPADDKVADTIEQYDAAHRERLAELVARRNIAPQHIIATRGRVETELCDKVADIGASVTVMGAVSRSRLRRWILGNTAEKILDRIESDVLIVKPDEGV